MLLCSNALISAGRLHAIAVILLLPTIVFIAPMFRRIFSAVIAISFCCCIWLWWLAGTELIAPAHAKIGAPPADLLAEDVQIHSDTGAEIKGWFIRGKPSRGSILLLHGIGANRLILIPRARLLSQLGFSVLMIDFQGHGESSGETITFGLVESHDAAAAVQFLKNEVPGEKIGAIGISLGGAALLLSNPSLPIDALVVESVYPTIEAAADNRIRGQIGALASIVSPLMLLQLPLRLHIYLSDLRPIDHVGGTHPPLLILSGTADKNTTLEESRNIFDRASQPKEFYWFDGAAHVDLYEYDKVNYSKLVTDFFGRYLKK